MYFRFIDNAVVLWSHHAYASQIESYDQLVSVLDLGWFQKGGAELLKLFTCVLLRLKTVVSINDFGQVRTG